MANLAQYLFQRAQANPESIAIIDKTVKTNEPERPPQMALHGYGAAELRFSEFAARIKRLAGGLTALAQTSHGDRVVICMENRPEFFDLLFACWTAGLCPVPVNAKLHPKEVVHILRDCDARVAFLSGRLAPDITAALADSEHKVAVFATNQASFAALYEGASMEPATVDPTELAWIFYTSGTTGRPKGAMLTHRNLLFMSLVYYADIEQVNPGDVKLHAAPLSHGSGLYALPHLFGGGTQMILEGFDPTEVLDIFEHAQNVTLFAAPTMVTRLLGQAREGATYPGLRTLYYGGGPMYLADTLRAIECFGQRVYQLYGQGESPMTITGLAKVDHQSHDDASNHERLMSCGRPRSGVEVRVVDTQGQSLPPGELGEVVTRSDAVMTGYWNNPTATANAIKEGWLWTGDIGSLDDRGYLTLKDRSKDMIISGGSNIYPREIEEVLLLHPGVLECSVVGRPHPDWGEEVVAFIVARADNAPDAQTLLDLCLAHIARFKRPKVFKFVPELPKNNYGKVLKTTLREWLKQETSDA